MFGVAFLYAGSLWFLFIVEVSPCGWVGLVTCQGFWLGKLPLVFWWVEVELFSLEYNKVSSNEFCGVYGFGVTFGRLYFCA